MRVLLGKGVDIAPERDTFGDWAQMYKLQRQVEYKRNNLTKSRLKITYTRLDDLSELSYMPVSKICTQDIQMIIDCKAIEGVSASVLKDIKSAAKQTLQLAVDNRVILYNPADAVKVGKDKHKEPTRRALTIEEQHWIESPTDNRGQIGAMIMLHAGLRRGELIPLQWTDIDLVNGTINIDKAVEIDGNKTVLKNYGKTYVSTRIVYIPKILIDFLTGKKKTATGFLCVHLQMAQCYLL